MTNNMMNNRIKVTPYDDSLLDRHSMYDTIPFTWDPDLNADKKFVLVTGNVIKSYRCQISDIIEVGYNR